MRARGSASPSSLPPLPLPLPPPPPPPSKRPTSMPPPPPSARSEGGPGTTTQKNPSLGGALLAPGPSPSGRRPTTRTTSAAGPLLAPGPSPSGRRPSSSGRRPTRRPSAGAVVVATPTRKPSSSTRKPSSSTRKPSPPSKGKKPSSKGGGGPADRKRKTSSKGKKPSSKGGGGGPADRKRKTSSKGKKPSSKGGGGGPADRKRRRSARPGGDADARRKRARRAAPPGGPSDLDEGPLLFGDPFPAPGSTSRDVRHALSPWWVAPFQVGKATHACVMQFLVATRAADAMFHDARANTDVIRAAQATCDRRALEKLDAAIVGPTDRRQWQESRAGDRALFVATMQKFAANHPLRKVLLDTGTRTLVFADPDPIYGDGRPRPDRRRRRRGMKEEGPARPPPPTAPPGQNRMGRTLMHVRKLLRRVPLGQDVQAVVDDDDDRVAG